MNLDKKSIWMMALAFEFIGAIAASLLLGNWIDQRWGFMPWATVVIVALTMVAMMFRLNFAMRRLEKQEDDDSSK